MTLIYIAFDVPAAKIEEVQAHLDYVALHDPDWGGAEFDIQREEHTYIPNGDGADAVTLLGQINSIILSDMRED